jgi:hypothetical protein
VPKERLNFYIDSELRDGMREVTERDGILEAEQIRRAVRDWLEKKGIAPKGKAAPRRGQTRRKA